MKIKKIEFCNINSLAGEWTIDFESPDFANSGMFCISGPTGSGKTSILDAICLGLYGKTPRLGAIIGDSNEVMTYGSKSCYAKVIFECGGNNYSAYWSQHRSSRTNKLQKYSWVLSNETTHTVEASFSKQSEIESTMTRVIGLDFGQFTKSMMLAQGEFNKFLKCNENERAAILEKLTGDSIYRKIAVAVHDLYANANKAVEDVENKMGAVALLSEEELAELNSKIEAASSQKESLALDEKRFGDICIWFENLHNIELLLQKAKSGLEIAEREKAGFEPNRERLERAMCAQEVESSYAEFNSVRGNLERMKTQLGECNSKLSVAGANLEKASKDSGEKQASFEKCKADYSENESVWQQVSTLDGDIRNVRAQFKNAETDATKIEQEIVAIQTKIKEFGLRISENETALKRVESYIAENGKDETIDGLLSLLKSQVAEWKAEKSTVAEALRKLESQKNALQEFDSACEQQKLELGVLRNYLTEHQIDADLVNLLPELNGYANDVERHHNESSRLQGEIESRQGQRGNLSSEREKAQADLVALLNEKESVIQSDIPVVVAELRRSLKPGEPCPVCGSREHLSCEDSAAIENGADRLNDFADKLRKINSEMEKIQRLLDGLAAREQNLNDALCELAERQKVEKAAEASAIKLLESRLEPWRISVNLESANLENDKANLESATPENIRGILQNLQTLKTTYLQKKESADDLQNKVNNDVVDRAKLAGELSIVEDAVKKSQDKSQSLSQKIEASLSPWFPDICMENVDDSLLELEKKNTWWKKAQEKKVRVEGELEKDRSGVDQHKEHLEQAQSRLDESKRKLDGLRENLATLEKNRKELFGEKSVDDERHKARTLRDTAEREADSARRLEQQMREAKIALDNSIAELNRHIADVEPKLAELQTMFLENLASKNFANELEFMAARLPESERKMLQQKQKSVDDNLTTAQTSVKNFNDQLAEHLQKRNFEESEDAAKQNCDDAKSKLNECTVNLATWIAQKNSDVQQRRKFSDMQAELSLLKSKRNDWEQMQRWFNGNRLDTGNGDVFVKFIQTITLRNLLKIANGYLHDMFPRYEMVTEPNTLNIQLVDHDNSDAVRPIDNISGGEGFLVSLSLALGISTLASRNVRIDSMFLDEGFGTLDAKMLQETVIVLQKMQQEKGKLLGVITHVDLVKSELPTHIEVTPCGGRSVLSGAGVVSSRP